MRLVLRSVYREKFRIVCIAFQHTNPLHRFMVRLRNYRPFLFAVICHIEMSAQRTELYTGSQGVLVRSWDALNSIACETSKSISAQLQRESGNGL